MKDGTSVPAAPLKIRPLLSRADREQADATVTNVAPVNAEQRTRALMEDHLDFIARTLRRMGTSSADIDDTVQSVFVAAFRKLDRIEVGRERAFLLATAIRVCSRSHRAIRRRGNLLTRILHAPIPPSPTPEDAALSSEARTTLSVVLDGLPEKLRVVFVLFELEQLGTPAIAALLDLPVGTVASRLRRAREIFEKRVAQLRRTQ